jgi:hypothetical protein
MVEQNRPGNNNREIIYSPTGFKMQIMNGATSTFDFVPLPGGDSVVYTPGGTYYRHADWLGSSRFATTTSRTVLYDGAYAPFGEPYARSGSPDFSFTGMNSDTSAGLYDFQYREYSTQGRWPSPGSRRPRSGRSIQSSIMEPLRLRLERTRKFRRPIRSFHQRLTEWGQLGFPV